MPTQYVKPYVKRGKNEAADAEAICEAVATATMRFVRWRDEQIAADTARFRLPLQRVWLQLLGLAAPAKSMSKILRVHDEGDFLGGQRLLAF
jgi:transposase